MESTHDEAYLQFLQRSLGTTSVPFFGMLITVISFILITILVVCNSTMTFLSPAPVVAAAAALPPPQPVVITLPPPNLRPVVF